MKFAHYDESTFDLLGWYSEDINGENIPTPNLPCSDDIWNAAIQGGHNKVDIVNGFLLYDESFESYKDGKIEEKARLHNLALKNDLKSSALGSDYIYPNEYFDDITLYKYVVIGGSGKVKCRPLESDQWSFAIHDAEQIKALAAEYMNTKQEALEAIECIKNACEPCITKEELETALNRL